MWGTKIKNSPFIYTTESGRTYTTDNPDDRQTLAQAFGEQYKSGKSKHSHLLDAASSGYVPAMNVLGTALNRWGENSGEYYLDDAISFIVDASTSEPVGQEQTLGQVGSVSNSMPEIITGNRENTFTSGAGTDIGEISRRPALNGALRRRTNTLG